MFITFEGPDGSGKTIQMKPTIEFLQLRGFTVYSAREPGGTSIGNQVREILMNMENTSMLPRTETLLFCAARAQLVEEVILPHLNKGEIVLLDRYADSTLAYQGYGHKKDISLISKVLDFATGGLKPDLTFLFDLDPRIGLKRRQTSNGEWNRMDAYQLMYHQRVRQGYLKMARKEPCRWRIIDATQSPDMVQSDIQNQLLEYFSKVS
ncbi:MAG: dTMP kinase [Anaerolineaceae bacterium]|nr:dTMP kinase [Anaerolineaceae bacterium]